MDLGLCCRVTRHGDEAGIEFEEAGELLPCSSQSGKLKRLQDIANHGSPVSSHFLAAVATSLNRNANALVA